MRGVSERESGAGRGGLRRAEAGRCRGSQDALGTGPAPPGPAARQGGSWGLPAPPPQQLAAAPGLRGAGERDVGRGLQAVVGPAPRPPSRVLPPGWGGGGRGRAGPQGGRAGGPRGAPENKRRRRRLLRGQNNLRWRRPKARPRPRALHLNPLRRRCLLPAPVGGRERPVPPRAGEVRAPGRGRALAGRDPGGAWPAALSSRHLALSPAPPPFPTWIP